MGYATMERKEPGKATARSKDRAATKSNMVAPAKSAVGEIPSASATVETTVQRLLSLLPPENKQVVLSMAEQSIAPHMDLLVGAQADRATAIAHGVLAPSEAMLQDEAALKAAVVARTLLALVSQALLLTAREREACEGYGVCAHVFSVAGGREAAQLRAEARRMRPMAAANREAGKTEREIYRFWGDAALKAAGAAHAARVHQLGYQRGIWPAILQRPVGQLDRRLTARPFWDSASFPAAVALERAHCAIRAELDRLLVLQDRSTTQGWRADRGSGGGGGGGGGGRMQPVFVAYKSDSLKAGAWTDFQLFANGQRDEAHCKLCPQTATAIAACPAFNELLCGAHFFSRLGPGTHIGAHCGPSNLRLRCHLGLRVPEGCCIRVGDEVRAWEEGKCLVFDDSFDHEACAPRLRTRARSSCHSP